MSDNRNKDVSNNEIFPNRDSPSEMKILVKKIFYTQMWKNVFNYSTFICEYVEKKCEKPLKC